MGKRYLNIDGKKVVTTEITYDDLVKLYKQYIDKFNLMKFLCFLNVH